MKKNIEFLVGMLFVLGVFAFFILAFRITSPSAFYSSGVNKKIYVEFNNIGNLKDRAQVTIGGFVVGRVTNVKLDPNTFIPKVELSINSRYFNIPSDSRFTILTIGVLGENYISIEPGFEIDLLQPGALVGSEFSSSAVVLEELLSKFVT